MKSRLPHDDLFSIADVVALQCHDNIVEKTVILSLMAMLALRCVLRRSSAYKRPWDSSICLAGEEHFTLLFRGDSSRAFLASRVHTAPQKRAPFDDILLHVIVTLTRANI